MPTPDLNFIVAPTNTFHIQIEPVQSNLHSLMLLIKAEQLSGLDRWVTETAAAMSAAERARHYLVVIGLHYAIMPDQSWDSFPAYLDHLAQVDANTLRDKVLDMYLACPRLDGREWDPEPTTTKAKLLSDVDYFVSYLLERFKSATVDEAVERQAHAYLNDPPALQRLVVDHLRHMWSAYLADEWRRIEPNLRDSVTAFQQLDLSHMSRREVAELVTGQPLDSWLASELEAADHLVLAPNGHVGPYVGRFARGRTLGILFRARLPAGTQFHAPDLSRSEILVRLSALADDARLRILKLIAEQGELSSQAVMSALDLSQSATSRHLKQLTATGYLSARRCDGAKCYQLERDRFDDTFRAILAFLE